MAMQKFNEFVCWHSSTAVSMLKIVPLWIYPLPILFMVFWWALSLTPVNQFLDKPTAEIIAPTVLLVTMLIAIWQRKNHDHPYFNWLLFFSVILFLRELHFYGTNNGFYLGFVLMIWWASKHRQRLQPYLFNKKLLSLFILIVWTYLISKSFDRHMWDSYLPAGVPSDLFEENLEVTGHLLTLVLVWISSKVNLSSQRQ